MNAYLSDLNKRVSEEQRHLAEQKNAKAQASRDRLTPLEHRLVRLLATIPVEMQRDGLALTSLQAQLRGRWRGNAHPGELGMALRKLGFERRRSWKKGAGFSALWYCIS